MLRNPTNRNITVLVLCLVAVPLLLLARRSYQVDFRAFYVASESLARHLDPYADNHLHGGELADPTNQASSSRWIYPPPALFFVAPLATVSYATAKLTFAALSFAALAWMLLYLARRFEVSPIWIALASVSLPVIACLQRGQIDLLILLLLVVTFRYERHAWSGLPLALAICIKIFPAPLLFWLVVKRRFRQATACLASILAIELLALWRFGLSSYAGFRHNLVAIQPVSLYADPIQLFHLPAFDGRIIGLLPGFIGSYNNPMVLLGRPGILGGAALVLLATILLRARRVSFETGFFTLVLVSQFINTRLWTMGMVMYLPICLIASRRLKSFKSALLLALPLFIPSQLRVAGICPRFVVAVLVVFYFILRDPARELGRDAAIEVSPCTRCSASLRPATPAAV